MVTLQQFFYQPNPTEIMAGREPYGGHISKPDLVKIIEGLKENQYLEIPVDVPVIPYELGSSNYIKKHGTLVRLKVYGSQHEAEEDKFAPWQQREEAFGGLAEKLQRSQGRFIYIVGYSWAGLAQDRNLVVARLVDSIDGVRYLYFSQKYASENEQVSVKDYDPASRVAREGASYFCQVPSRKTGERLPKFVIKSVPVVDNAHKYSLALCISSDHACEETSNSRLFFRDPKTGVKDVRVLDSHFVASYLAIIALEQSKFDAQMQVSYEKRRAEGQRVVRKACVPMEMNVVALPTQEEMIFDAKMRYQIVVKEPIFKGGRVTSKKRPLNRLEREILHWNRVSLRGVRPTFFATKLLREYELPYFVATE